MIHLDESRRDEAIFAAYASASSRLAGMPLDEFAKRLDECEIKPVVIDGEMAGAVICKGPEIHACILEKFKCRWMSKDVLRLLRRVVAKHGYATTQATTQEGRVFVERLGFEFDGQSYVLR